MESEFSLLKSPFKSKHFRQDSIKNFNLKKKKNMNGKFIGTSFIAQWIGIHLSMQGT